MADALAPAIPLPGSRPGRVASPAALRGSRACSPGAGFPGDRWSDSLAQLFVTFPLFQLFSLQSEFLRPHKMLIRSLGLAF
jgi:hypothetical protein